MMITSITHEIEHNPEPEDAETIQIGVAITKRYQSNQWDLYEEVLIESIGILIPLLEPIEVEYITELLTESGDITPLDAYNAILDLFRLVHQVSFSDDYNPDCVLRVWMTLTIVIDHPNEEVARSQTEELVSVSSIEAFEEEHGLEDEHDIIQTEDEVMFDFDHQIEEVSRVSFNETNTAGLRPASKLAVESLNRKIYKKTTEAAGEIACVICLEEFNDGGSTTVSLPCGHQFDDECIVEWFLRSHLCPLCRFEMPRER